MGMVDTMSMKAKKNMKVKKNMMSTKVRKVMMNMRAREFSLSLILERQIFKVPMLLIQVA